MKAILAKVKKIREAFEAGEFFLAFALSLQLASELVKDFEDGGDELKKTYKASADDAAIREEAVADLEFCCARPSKKGDAVGFGWETLLVQLIPVIIDLIRKRFRQPTD